MKPAELPDSGGEQREVLAGADMSVEAPHLWLMLSKVYRSLRAHAETSIRRLGLIESDFAVLEAVLHSGPMQVNVLGRKVSLASSSITAAVDRLERRGLVRRQGDQHDRRSRLVALTKEGSGLIVRAFTDHRKALEESAAALSIEEREQLLKLLRKWGHSAESTPPTERTSVDTN